MRKSTIYTLAAASATATAVFPAVVITLNLIQHRSYDPVEQAISELALGTGGMAMALAFCSLGVGIASLAVIVRSQSPGARIVPVILALAAVLAGPMSAAFHTDLTGAPPTVHGTIHNDVGLAAFLLLLAAMVISSVSFRRDPFWRAHTMTTRILTVAGVISFALIPGLGADHFGLAQRLFVGTFVTWLIVTALYARIRCRSTARTRADADAAAARRSPRSSARSTSRSDPR